MRDVAVIHPGVQHSADLATALDRTERLAFLATRLQVGRDAGFPWSGSLASKLLDRRTSPTLDDRRIQRLGVASELLLRGLGRNLPRAAVDRIDHWSVNRFNRRVIRRLDHQVSAVFATDTAALRLFSELRRTRPDIARVLDVSHPLDVVVQRLMVEDAHSNNLELRAYDDFHEGRVADQIPELDSAHGVVVASRFSASTLEEAGFPLDRVWIVPYGVRGIDPTPRRPFDGTLRLLALGAMSERKGMTVLLREMGRLSEMGVPAHLSIAGREAGEYRLPPELPANCTYVGSPSGEEVRQLYLASDVLVLPSMCEGFGRTLLEALAHGCSVITTERSGGPDIVSACPSAPVSILPVDQRDQLTDLVIRHLDDRATYLRPADAREAAQVFSEEAYRKRLAQVLDEVTSLI